MSDENCSSGSGGSCSCFGCVLNIIGAIVFVWIIFNWSQFYNGIIHILENTFR